MITLRMPTRPSEIASHVRMAHGVWLADNDTPQSMRACHRACHEQEWGQSPIAHVHTGRESAR